MQPELAAHEQYPQYGFTHHRNPHHGGQAKQHHHPHPPIYGAGEIGRVGIHMFLRQGWQDHCADSHCKQAEGEFQQAIRIVEVADGTGGQKRGQHGVDQQVDLADRDAE